MNEAFIIGFLDELEKKAFLGKQDLKKLQAKLKELQKHLSKKPQVEVVPSESGKVEEKPIKPGSAMESAKSMAGDVARKVKSLKPLRRRTESIRRPRPGMVERARGWFGRNR
jgi:hypothetical protein